MTLEEIGNMLDETELPNAYDHFAEGESPEPPFLVFLLPGSNHFGADGKVYRKITELDIELYTDYKDPDTEALLEDVLDAHDIYYTKDETYIESERLYEVIYSTEVLYDANHEQG